METAVISCVSNQAAGMSDEELTEEEVLAAMKEASGSVKKLICGLMRGLEEQDKNKEKPAVGGSEPRAR
jgi:purine nucleoside phosphorylase